MLRKQSSRIMMHYQCIVPVFLGGAYRKKTARNVLAPQDLRCFDLGLHRKRPRKVVPLAPVGAVNGSKVQANPSPSSLTPKRAKPSKLQLETFEEATPTKLIYREKCSKHEADVFKSWNLPTLLQPNFRSQGPFARESSRSEIPKGWFCWDFGRFGIYGGFPKGDLLG